MKKLIFMLFLLLSKIAVANCVFRNCSGIDDCISSRKEYQSCMQQENEVRRQETMYRFNEKQKPYQGAIEQLKKANKKTDRLYQHDLNGNYRTQR